MQMLLTHRQPTELHLAERLLTKTLELHVRLQGVAMKCIRKLPICLFMKHIVCVQHICAARFHLVKLHMTIWYAFLIA